MQRLSPLAVHTREMFATGHDFENRAAGRDVAGTALDPVGVGRYGPKNVVDKDLEGARLHP